jgi:hypothetical protein
MVFLSQENRPKIERGLVNESLQDCAKDGKNQPNQGSDEGEPECGGKAITSFHRGLHG